MSWLNGKMGKSTLGPYQSLLQMIPLPVPSMPGWTTCLILVVGSTLWALQGETRNSLGWSTKPCSGLDHATSMDVRSHRIITMLLSLTSKMATPSGKTVLLLRWLNPWVQDIQGLRQGRKTTRRLQEDNSLPQLWHEAWWTTQEQANADGHLTKFLLNSIYSGVDLLCRLHFLSSLPSSMTWCLGNRHWQCLPWSGNPRNGLYHCWPKFGELEGYRCIIFKALYGLRTSGFHWYKCFASCLRDMGFSNHAKQSLTFRCGIMETSMSTLLYYMWMTLLQQPRTQKLSLTYNKTNRRIYLS